MHDPVRQTGQWLKSVVQGHFNYYAVPGNLTSLGVFRNRVLALWWRTIRRRSQKHRINWTRMLVLATDGFLNRVRSIPFRCSLRRHSSEIRTGCANQRPSGSVRGVPRNRYPYRDRFDGWSLSEIAIYQQQPFGIAIKHRQSLVLRTLFKPSSPSYCRITP